MLRALIYLRLNSFRNWLLWRARRLRQPKYLVGAIVGVAYFYFFFFRRITATHHLTSQRAMPGMTGEAIPVDWMPFALVVGTVAIAVILLFGWIVPAERAALGFTEAEIAFLFPAPVTRRSLVHFRLLTSQLRTLMAGAVMALLSNRWSFAGGSPVIHLFGWWLVFSTLNLHFTAAHFTLTRLADRGLSVTARRLALLAVVAVVVAIALARVPGPERLPDLGATLRSYSDWALGLAATAPLSWALFPLRLVVQPFFAQDWHQFAVVIGPALLVMVAHYFWVVQVVVSFEDASIAQAERRAARVAAWRSGERRGSRSPAGARPAPFDLSKAKRPEWAFLWKNLLSTWPYFTPRAFGIVAGVVVVASWWLNTRSGLKPVAVSLGWIALVSAVYILVLGPQFARQDVRSDIRRLDVLKTYPLAGWQIVLGELLTPAAILTGFVWLALLTFLLNAELGKGMLWFSPGVRIAGGIGAAILVPPVVVLQLLVPNAAALVFPSWFEASRTRGGGPEVIGQRMIFLFAQLLTIVLVLLPAALVGAGLIVLGQLVMGLPLAILLAVIPIVAVLVGEVALALWWLGGRFEQVDVAEELRA